jgi:polyphosphate kinase 2 (PPK2 family)
MSKASAQDKPNPPGAVIAANDGRTAVADTAENQPDGALSRKDYRSQLNLLQVELVKLQKHIIRSGEKVVILLEGRDAAGKDGSIKRIVEYLSPRETRVVALGVPSSRQQQEWYFQRYIAHLPVAEEIVLFNRSWYNRAGVERVMGFCTNDEYQAFLQSVCHEPKRCIARRHRQTPLPQLLLGRLPLDAHDGPR